MDAQNRIESWIEELLASPDFSHVFVVELKVRPNNRVELFIDADQGVDFELCGRVSRALEAKLDESLVLGERYTLEVSSPGVKRPLVLPRQFHKHIGRSLAIELVDGSKFTAKLEEVGPLSLKLSEEVIRKEKNKKIKEQLQHEVPYEQLKGALVQLSFK